MTEVYYVHGFELEHDLSHIFWQLISILTYPLDEQIAIIGGLPTKRLSKTPYITNSFLFYIALYEYNNCWLDEFDEKLWDKENEQPIIIFHQFKETLLEMNQSDCYSSKEFNNHRWQRLRRLAVEILQKVELPAMDFDEIATPIKWGELVRVFVNEYGNIQVD